MVVVQAASLALHQLPGHARQSRMLQHRGIVRVSLPGTKIFHKTARVVGLAGHQRQRAQVGQVVLDAGGELGQFVGIEQAAQHHRAIARKGLHSLRRQLKPCGHQIHQNSERSKARSTNQAKATSKAAQEPPTNTPRW